MIPAIIEGVALIIIGANQIRLAGRVRDARSVADAASTRLATHLSLVGRHKPGPGA